MPVRKVGERWLVDIRYKGDRYRIRSPGTSKGDAQAHEVYLRGELAEHGTLSRVEQPVREIPTVAEFSEKWMRTYPASSNNRASEITNKRSVLRAHLLPAFGTMRLDALGAYEIASFKASRAEHGLAPKTVNNILTVLRCLLNSAVEWGILEKLPLMRFASIKPPDFRFLSYDEAGRLLDAATDPVWRVAILLGLHTGLRWGEIAALSWDDVSFERRQLTIRHAFSAGVLERPKNGRIRYLPLTTVAAVELQALPRIGRHVLSLRGNPLMRENALYHLKRIARRAGIEPCGWHVLRHTFASHLVQRGVPAAIIKELLGHSSLRMTERYAHLMPAGTSELSPILAGAVALLEDAAPIVGTPWALAPRFSVRTEAFAESRTQTPLG